MWKVLGGVVVGVFVGAFAVEVIKRLRPDMLEGIERRARGASDALAGAFKSGYSRQVAD